jgi:hypothetical protein
MYSTLKTFLNKDRSEYGHWMHNDHLQILPKFLFLPYPARTITDKEYANILNRKVYSQITANFGVNGKFDKLSLEEQLKYKIYYNDDGKTLPDIYYKHANTPGALGWVMKHIPLPTYLLASGFDIGINYVIPTINFFMSTKSLLSFGLGLQLYYEYLDTLKKSLRESRRLYNLITKLYDNNNIALEDRIPEYNLMKNIFIENKQSILNKLIKKKISRIKSYINTLIDFSLPGLTAYVYFKEIQDSEELLVQKSFISSIDIALAKQKLLTQENTNFTIPQFIDSSNDQITLNIKDMWAPFTNKLVFNSIQFDNTNKNMIIVGPVASGKTMILSIILTVLYFSHMGIVPAKYCALNYFDYIIAHMEHRYTIGEGISQHLAERASMSSLLQLIELLPSSKKAIVFIDEIYRGTLPNLAIKEAFKDLPNIFTKNNTIAIVTTHFPQITAMTDMPEYKANLFYMFVKHIGNIFQPTYLLCKDDQFNWWIRNEDLAFAYQLSYDRK